MSSEPAGGRIPTAPAALVFVEEIPDCAEVCIATAGVAGVTMDTTVLEQLIGNAIPGADVRAVDLQGSGDHFEVTVVSPDFEGRTLVQRHRMVYEAIGDAMSGPIHAMTIKALTPDQFQGDMVELSGDGDRRD